MTELGLILFGALLVNNFVLAQFLGLCPFMGITRSFDTALATGLATTFVLALAAVTSHTLYHFLLVPLQLTYLNIIVFIMVIAGLVQVIQLYLKATSPVLHQVLGVYLPLITSNCAVLGVTLLAINQELTLLATFVFAVGAAGGFTLVMVLFGALREQLAQSSLPNAFAGTPIALLSAGLMSLAFMGFQGIGSRWPAQRFRFIRCRRCWSPCWDSLPWPPRCCSAAFPRIRTRWPTALNRCCR